MESVCAYSLFVLLKVLANLCRVIKDSNYFATEEQVLLLISQKFTYEFTENGN
jgi:hypothetical protein